MSHNSVSVSPSFPKDMGFHRLYARQGRSADTIVSSLLLECYLGLDIQDDFQFSYCGPGIKPVAKEAIDLRREATIRFAKWMSCHLNIDI